VGWGVPAFINYSPPGAIKAKIGKDQILLLCEAITGEAMYLLPWVYTAYPTGAERFAVMAGRIMENWQEDRPSKIAFIGPYVEYFQGPLGESKKYAESIGMEWLPPEFVLYVPFQGLILVPVSDWQEAPVLWPGE